jgi:hypothetical protein
MILSLLTLATEVPLDQKVIEGQLLRVPHSVLLSLARSWGRLSSSAAGLLFACYREAVVRLKELAVEEKRQQLAKQRANDVIDLVLKVEKIKDPQLREKVKAAIVAGGHAPLPRDDAAA